jgi:probable rRNA maturation factor
LVILEKEVAALSAAALERFVRRARRAAGLQGSVNVLVTTGRAVRALNQRFRGKHKDTDVLSFPAPQHGRKGAFAGDIAISAEIAARNAERLGHSTAQEIKILVLHGILHLAGYDHERDNGRMARKEAKLRQVLRLPGSLIERAQGPHETRTGKKYRRPRRVAGGPA